MSDEIRYARKHAIEVAKDLKYPREVRERIRKAENEKQITNIMTQARRAMA